MAEADLSRLEVESDEFVDNVESNEEIDIWYIGPVVKASSAR